MKDVFLIVPPYSYTEIIKVRGNRRKKGGFYVFYPHLGLLYLAAILKKQKINVGFCDMSAEGVSEADLKQKLRESNPKIVGVTVTTPTLPSAYRVIQLIKKVLPKIKIVVGGAHISAMPNSTFELGADYGFVGEAEIGFLDFCRNLLKGKKSAFTSKGLIYKGDKKVIINPQYFVKDLEKLPFPARELSTIESYFSPVRGGRISSMIASRGCPYACVYCSRPAVERNVRFRFPNKVVDEMALIIKDYDVRYINFEDDTFTLNKKLVEGICTAIIRKRIKIAWGCQTRADLVDQKLLRLMKKAGCVKISFGVESGSERVRFLLGKRITDIQIRKAFAWAHNLGIETNAFYMFGHFGEEESDLQKTVSMAKDLNSTYAAFNLTTVYPSSPLFELARKEGKVKPSVWSNYMKGGRKLVVYVPKGLSLATLRKYQQKAFVSFYLRPKFILKQIKTISNPLDLWVKSKVGFVVLRDFVLG